MCLQFQISHSYYLLTAEMSVPLSDYQIFNIEHIRKAIIYPPLQYGSHTRKIDHQIINFLNSLSSEFYAIATRYLHNQKPKLLQILDHRKRNGLSDVSIFQDFALLIVLKMNGWQLGQKQIDLIYNHFHKILFRQKDEIQLRLKCIIANYNEKDLIACSQNHTNINLKQILGRQHWKIPQSKYCPSLKSSPDKECKRLAKAEINRIKISDEEEKIQEIQQFLMNFTEAETKESKFLKENQEDIGFDQISNPSQLKQQIFLSQQILSTILQQDTIKKQFNNRQKKPNLKIVRSNDLSQSKYKKISTLYKEYMQRQQQKYERDCEKEDQIKRQRQVFSKIKINQICVDED